MQGGATSPPLAGHSGEEQTSGPAAAVQEGESLPPSAEGQPASSPNTIGDSVVSVPRQDPLSASADSAEEVVVRNLPLIYIGAGPPIMDMPDISILDRPLINIEVPTITNDFESVS